MMEVTKILALCCFMVLTVTARHRNRLEEQLEDIVENIVEKEMEKEHDEDNDPAFVVPTDNPKLGMCWKAGIYCEHCSSCFTGGWCVKDLVNQPGPKCLCNYGWTGPNANYIPDNDKYYHETGWGRYRIRADNCLEPCHYTYDVKNATCADECHTRPSMPINSKCCGRYPDQPGCQCTKSPLPQKDKDYCCANHADLFPKQFCKQDLITCHNKCGRFNGKCTPYLPGTHKDDKRCLCCRGWAGDNKVWSPQHGRYYADYCHQKCPYDKDNNGRNDKCKEIDDTTPKCNPKCTDKNNGKCLDNGRCECCRQWTGPNAEEGKDGKINADYCDVYCPETAERTKYGLCTREDYVNRRRTGGFKIDV